MGLQFDALRIKMSGAKEETRLFGYESIRDMIQKFVFVGDDRNITQVFVNGKIVKDISNSDLGSQKKSWLDIIFSDKLTDIYLNII